MTEFSSRRRFLGSVAASGAALFAARLGTAQQSRPASRPGGAAAASGAGPIELPPLPWKENALDPVISGRTIGFHYGKHHAGYVSKLNAAIRGGEWEEWTLEKIIRTAHEQMGADPKKKSIFNNAAQVWNHTFYWNGMRPGGGGKPSGKVLDAIEKSFGSYEKLREALIAASAGQFGSGWGWLVADEDGKLEVMATGNADLPLVHGKKALLTIDVWEHAYYLDWQNQRKAYLDAFMDKLVNWDHVAQQLG